MSLVYHWDVAKRNVDNWMATNHGLLEDAPEPLRSIFVELRRKITEGHGYRYEHEYDQGPSAGRMIEHVADYLHTLIADHTGEPTSTDEPPCPHCGSER